MINFTWPAGDPGFRRTHSWLCCISASEHYVIQMNEKIGKGMKESNTSKGNTRQRALYILQGIQWPPINHGMV